MVPATTPHATASIAFLTHYTELYGANLSLLNLIDGLNGYGYQSHVIAPEGGDLLAELERRRIPAVVLPFEWWVSAQPSLAGSMARHNLNLQNVVAIQQQLAEWQTDIVYEAMGRVTAEAMACYRPVIGYDSGGTSELIDHGRTGLLYRGGEDALADCMIRYATSPEEARQHGEAAWEIAKARHSTEAYAAAIHSVLNTNTETFPRRKTP